MRFPSTRTALAVTGASAAAFVGVLGLTQAGGSGASDARAQAATAADPQVAHAFKALTRPAQPGELPDNIQSVIAAQNADYGLNPALGRQLATAPGEGTPTYLVPGRGEACIVTTGIATSVGCTTSDSLVANGIQGVTLVGKGTYRVTSVLPDGATGVTLKLAGGATTAMPASENVAAKTVSGTPTDLQWTDASGAVRSQQLFAPAG